MGALQNFWNVSTGIVFTIQTVMLSIQKFKLTACQFSTVKQTIRTMFSSLTALIQRPGNADCIVALGLIREVGTGNIAQT